MTRSRAAAIWLFTAFLAASACLLYGTLVAPRDAETASEHWLLALALTCGFAFSERFAVYIRLGAQAFAFTFSEMPLVLALYFLPPDLVIGARLAGSVLAAMWLRRNPQKAAFNLSMFALESVAAVLVWHWILGPRDALGPWGWLAVAVVIATTSLLGSACVSVVITLATGRRPRNLGEIFSLGQLGDLMNGAFALNAIYVLVVDWRGFWLLASVIAVLVIAYRSYDRARQRSERLQQINRFTERVGREVEVEHVVRAVLEGVRSTFDARVVELSLTTGPEPSAEWIDDGELRPGRAVVLSRIGAPAESPLLLSRSSRDDQQTRRASAAGVRDAMVVPLRSEGRVLGSIAVADSLGEVATFSDSDLDQLQALANHAAVALDNATRASRIIEQAHERAMQALRDELTGLANRRLLGIWLDECLASGSAALLLLDIDRFREVNDTLGHEIGDGLLCMVGERIAATLPPQALLSRPGGDEFAVVLPGVEEPAAVTCAEAIADALAEPFGLEGISVAVQASVGVAMSQPGTDRVSLFRWADMAMYSAKDSRAGFEIYRPGLERTETARLGLLADLRAAVNGGSLTVLYQPKVDMATGSVTGAEALTRWSHDLYGPIPPDDFIPLAEHSSLIRPLTLHVLRRSLRDCEKWRALFGDFTVAVNISVRSLMDDGFVADVRKALHERSVPARALTLEITETSLMSDPDRAVAALEALRSLGVRLSVDDLGTGYSSLAYLRSLPVDEIKIDRSFVQELEDHRSLAVVSSMVELGRRLGHGVVAEGIETPEGYDTLAGLGCTTAQGYWIGRPMSAADLSRLVDGWNPLPVSGLRAVR